MSQAHHSAEAESLGGPPCFECELPISADAPVLDREKRALCAACAAEYYVECAGGCGLAPKDSLAARGGELFCPVCFAVDSDALAIPSESQAKALVDEYVGLAAEHKRLGKRMDEIKESLKLAASVRERAGNAVTIRGDNGAVKCGYQTRVNCDAERALEIEPILGAELFAELFDRSVAVKAKKDAVLRVLEDDGASDEVRDAVRSAIAIVEVETLNVKS